MRLGFHDCVGGCDGCVDMTEPDNFGLDIPIDALADVVASYARDGLTRADIWAMAAMIGTDDSQPRDNLRDYDFEWYGRSTCDAADGKGGDALTMPSVDFNTAELLHFFSTEFGFDERQTVAIMGAHSIGTLSQQNSGFNGPDGWTGNNRRLDNRYYGELIGGDRDVPTTNFDDLIDAPQWTQELVDNSQYPNIPNRFQWVKGGDGDDDPIMTNADIALSRDFSGYISAGQVNCVFKNPKSTPRCPHAAQTWDYMIEFKFNDGAFLEALRDAFMEILHHGTGVQWNGCSSPPCKI